MAESDVKLLHVASDGSHHALIEIEPGGPRDDRGVRAVARERRDPTKLYRCAEPDCSFFVELASTGHHA
ncbi:MAG: hypothetical protein EPN50_10470 [Chloroflexota bacterium]|jgi:hypothetical protein|nr:MAG: hypothetical protein EPN50_10470 [Chloroflexota bacterium]